MSWERKNVYKSDSGMKTSGCDRGLLIFLKYFFRERHIFAFFVDCNLEGIFEDPRVSDGRDEKMNRPKRNDNAKYLTVPQMIEKTNLCRSMVVRLAREAGAYLSFGRAVRIDAEKFFLYTEKEYTE